LDKALEAPPIFQKGRLQEDVIGQAPAFQQAAEKDQRKNRK